MIAFDDVLALRQRTIRDTSRLFLIEGTRFLIRAERAHAALVGLIITSDLVAKAHASSIATIARRARAQGAWELRVGRDEFAALTLLGEPQGIAAVVRQRWTPIDALPSRRRDLFLAVEEVRAPGNLGTMLRTAEAAGCRGVVFLSSATDPFDPRALRSSMGSIFGLELTRARPDQLMRWARKHRMLIVGSSAQATCDYRSVDYKRRLVLTVGSEREGLSEAQQDLCDKIVRIPMQLGPDSLNVAVATGILLFEIRAQRFPAKRSASNGFF